jgi:hypothetical protein
VLRTTQTVWCLLSNAGALSSHRAQPGCPPYNTPMIEAEELEAGEVVLKEEDEDDDAMLNAIENVILVTKAEEKATAESEDLNVGVSSEQTFSTGMVSTPNILRQQGLLASTSRAPSAAPQPQTLKVTDYLVSHQLDDALAAGQDLIISWPFANGQISDFMQANISKNTGADVAPKCLYSPFSRSTTPSIHRWH